VKKLLLALLLVPAAAASLRAGAWTSPRGGWYMEEGTSSFQTDRDLGGTGHSRKKDFNGVYDDTTYKTYLEYGAVERWTVITSIPYRKAHYVDDYSDINNGGLQDLTAGVKWGWKTKPWVVSFAGFAYVPMGYNASAPLGKSLGTGRGNAEGRAIVSRELKNMPGRSSIFVTGELGKDRYGVPYSLEAFWLHAKWIYTKLYINGVQPWPHHWDSQEYAQWTASVGLTSRGRNVIMRSAREQSFGLSVGYGRLIRGRNTGRGDTISLSVAYVL